MSARANINFIVVMLLAYLIATDPTIASWLPSGIVTPTGELGVVLLQESSQPLNRDQIAALASSEIVRYLNEKCGKIAGRPAWRNWDKDVDVSNAPAEWQELLQLAKASAKTLPALVVLRGKSAMAYPISNEADMLEILRKAGG